MERGSPKPRDGPFEPYCSVAVRSCLCLPQLQLSRSPSYGTVRRCNRRQVTLNSGCLPAWLPNFVTSTDNRSVALNSSISKSFFSLFPDTVRLPNVGVKRHSEQTIGQGEEDRLVGRGPVLSIPRIGRRVPHIWNMPPCSW